MWNLSCMLFQIPVATQQSQIPQGILIHLDWNRGEIVPEIVQDVEGTPNETSTWSVNFLCLAIQEPTAIADHLGLSELRGFGIFQSWLRLCWKSYRKLRAWTKFAQT